MPENKPQDQLLTPEEAAARLKISRLTIGDWLRSGKLKGVKVGRLWRVRERDLVRFWNKEISKWLTKKPVSFL